MVFVASQLSRQHNLETIDFTYILPLLEYACELWDGCTQQEYNKIEHIQHEAVRIITRLPKFSSLESIFRNWMGKDNKRLIGCLVSRKNNTFWFRWAKVNEPFF
jgi:hypothetical protein